MQSLDQFRRYQLLHSETKIEPLDRLSNFLQGPRIFVKRDDQNEIGGGGNKLRKLEFLLGAAELQNADTIITSGARQSNHAFNITCKNNVTADTKHQSSIATNPIIDFRWDFIPLSCNKMLIEQLLHRQ